MSLAAHNKASAVPQGNDEMSWYQRVMQAEISLIHVNQEEARELSMSSRFLIALGKTARLWPFDPRDFDWFDLHNRIWMGKEDLGYSNVERSLKEIKLRFELPNRDR
jgi:hypothetical protein